LVATFADLAYHGLAEAWGSGHVKVTEWGEDRPTIPGGAVDFEVQRASSAPDFPVTTVDDDHPDQSPG